VRLAPRDFYVSFSHLGSLPNHIDATADSLFHYLSIRGTSDQLKTIYLRNLAAYPGDCYHPLRMPDYSIGLDLGGTNLRAAAIDRSGKMLDKISGATDFDAGKDAVLDDISSAIAHLREKHGAGGLAGIGIGVPGFIRMKEGVITNCNNLPFLENVPIRDEISGRLGTFVILENDANAAAWALQNPKPANSATFSCASKVALKTLTSDSISPVLKAAVKRRAVAAARLLALPPPAGASLAWLFASLRTFTTNLNPNTRRTLIMLSRAGPLSRRNAR
jgi:hypothetical protein